MTWPNQSQRSLACLRVDAMAVPRPQGSCFQLNGWGAAKRMKEVAPLLPTRGTSRAHVTRKLSHPASSAQRPHTHRHKESLSLPGSRSLPRRTRPRRLHSDGTQPLPRVRPTQARGVGQCENVKKKKKRTCQADPQPATTAVRTGASRPAGAEQRKDNEFVCQPHHLGGGGVVRKNSSREQGSAVTIWRAYLGPQPLTKEMRATLGAYGPSHDTDGMLR